MRISFCTLGCKLNQAETDEIANELKKLGYVIVPFKKPADVAVVRACAVTQNASQTTRELIRQAKRSGSCVIASGCLENRDLPEIDFVADDPKDIIKIITSIRNEAKLSDSSDNFEAPNKTRALIKIQTGCNFKCAYCVIPRYRGKSKSFSAINILKKVINAQKIGCHEIVLTGVNICQYRSGKLDFTGLIKKILLNTKIERIRLGSLDPRLVNNNLINLFANPRLTPHCHLSLQSGSDIVLKRMNRGYTTNTYRNIVKKLRKINPLFSLTTDIIVGFPGETDEEFARTVSFVNEMEFAKVHVFHYSKRPDTPAAILSGQVQDRIKTKRVSQLIEVSRKTANKFAHKLIGKKREILFEQKKNSHWLGYSPEYVPVKFKSGQNLKNKIICLKITKSNLF